MVIGRGTALSLCISHRVLAYCHYALLLMRKYVFVLNIATEYYAKCSARNTWWFYTRPSSKSQSEMPRFSGARLIVTPQVTYHTLCYALRQLMEDMYANRPVVFYLIIQNQSIPSRSFILEEEVQTTYKLSVICRKAKPREESNTEGRISCPCRQMLCTKMFLSEQ